MIMFNDSWLLVYNFILLILHPLRRHVRNLGPKYLSQKKIDNRDIAMGVDVHEIELAIVGPEKSVNKLDLYESQVLYI